MKNNLIAINGKIGSGKDTIGLIIQYLRFVETGYGGVEFSVEEFQKFNDGFYQGGEIESLSGFKIKKFADKLKDIVCLLLNCTREQLEDRDFKEAELPEEWRIWDVWVSFIEGTKIFSSKEAAEKFHSEVWDDTGSHIKSYLPTPRLLLQLLGTECGREIIHPNIWVNALFNEYNKNFKVLHNKEKTHFYGNGMPLDNWIITDMRFPNELKAVKDRGGISIRIEREHCCGKVDICDFGDGYNCAKPQSTHPSETALDNAEFDYTIDNNGTIEELVEKVREILIKEEII